MLKKIEIKNYVLIESLTIQFDNQFNIITGETGAGKSILLGALGLLMGKRADTSVVRSDAKKCIIEGTIEIQDKQIKELFAYHDLDFENECLIRRELTSNGKSRCFINDSPVNLQVLKQIAQRLIDIHSQHENLLLTDDSFQLNVLDQYAGLNDLLSDYQSQFKSFQELSKKIAGLEKMNDQSKLDQDYLNFQLNELQEAQLKEGELEALENELEILSNTEEITATIQHGVDLLNADNGAYDAMHQLSRQFLKLSGISPKVDEVAARLQSVSIELDDLRQTMEGLTDEFEYNPERIQMVNDRVDLLNALLSKHRKQHVSELIALFNEIDEQLQHIDSLDDQITALRKELVEKEHALNALASQISEKRNGSQEALAKEIVGIVRKIGLKDAEVRLKLTKTGELSYSGNDELELLFSANKGVAPQPLLKAASGGEMSRMMLAVKSILARKSTLPTIVFDEIDTGVSGDVADKMGELMRKMSQQMQLICITHLPQIAAKGTTHFKVYKYNRDNETHSNIKALSPEERVEEVAGMLSGSKLTDAALLNAKELLQ